MVTTGAVRHAKLQSSRYYHQPTKHPAVYRPDALPVSQPMGWHSHNEIK